MYFGFWLVVFELCWPWAKEAFGFVLDSSRAYFLVWIILSNTFFSLHTFWVKIPRKCLIKNQKCVPLSRIQKLSFNKWIQIQFYWWIMSQFLWFRPTVLTWLDSTKKFCQSFFSPFFLVMLLFLVVSLQRKAHFLICCKCRWTAKDSLE